MIPVSGSRTKDTRKSVDILRRNWCIWFTSSVSIIMDWNFYIFFCVGLYEPCAFIVSYSHFRVYYLFVLLRFISFISLLFHFLFLFFCSLFPCSFFSYFFLFLFLLFLPPPSLSPSFPPLLSAYFLLIFFFILLSLFLLPFFLPLTLLDPRLLSYLPVSLSNYLLYLLLLLVLLLIPLFSIPIIPHWDLNLNRKTFKLHQIFLVLIRLIFYPQWKS